MNPSHLLSPKGVLSPSFWREGINGMRPLGNFGDITLNQLLENIHNYNFSMVLNNTELLVYPTTFLPFSLLYYKLVKS